MARRKISAVTNEFSDKIRSLNHIDIRNQERHSSNGQSTELVLLTEAIFFRGFRAYENFLEDIFVLYTMEKPTIRGRVRKSYLQPKNFEHARELLSSGKRFLDWTNPETVIERAEHFLKNGGIIKNPLIGAKRDLLDMRALRNHIAHNSKESHIQFEKVVRRARGTLPVHHVRPGDHLLSQVRGGAPESYYLDYYFDRLLEISEAIAEK